MKQRNEGHRVAGVLKGAMACLALAGVVLAGCAAEDHVAEADLIARLEGSGLTIERLEETKISSQQRQRLEAKPVSMFSARVTDGDRGQTITLIEFDKNWQADAVASHGVTGFAVKNWFFLGVISGEFRSKIEAALL